jgi:beta-galactosidase/beta-glucuronidase
MTIQYRTEHPRPQFIRESWVNLNGEWEFEFDDQQIGDQDKWELGTRPFSRRIQVPFAFQSQLSGIADPDFHDTVWYRRELLIPGAFSDKQILLHFGAVDYEATVWVNGVQVAHHEGGHTPFQANITNVLTHERTNIIVVKVVDFSKDLSLPRGKQYWQQDSASIFYTRTTGIWQTVWMEAVSRTYINNVTFTPDIDKNEIEIRTFFKGQAIDIKTRAHAQDLKMKVAIRFKGHLVADDMYHIHNNELVRRIDLSQLVDLNIDYLWSPHHPNLFDITFTLLDKDHTIDHVTSYFGMRKVSTENGRLCLNNRPYFQKLILDQGYFPDGNLTPPSDEAIKRDVELTKAMGFNGARKHQKLEDPRYLYWCDVLGLIVWSEAANAYEYSEEYVRRFTREWQESIDRDYNHPCILTWVPINESWGVGNIQIDRQQQHHAMSMYHLTKSLDPTRHVVSNDGESNQGYASRARTCCSWIPIPRATDSTYRIRGYLL